MATDLEELAVDAAEEPAKKGGLLKSKKAKVLILVLVVMTAEAAGMWIFFGGSGGGGSDAAELEDPADVETIEVNLGEFRAQNATAIAGSQMQITFTIIADVAESQAAEFEQLAKRKHNGAVWSLVQRAGANASLDELNDPSIRVLRRTIREDINKLLGKSYVRQVHLIKFTKIVL